MSNQSRNIYRQSSVHLIVSELEQLALKCPKCSVDLPEYVSSLHYFRSCVNSSKNKVELISCGLTEDGYDKYLANSFMLG
jgi:hypothetical protein